MLTSNYQKLNRNELTKAIGKSKSNTFEVFDIHNPKDIKEVQKSIEKSIKKGSVSVVIIEGDK